MKLLSTFLLLVTLAAAPAETVLTLGPSKENPRNSEGDFIALRDGRILFIYTRFTGGGSDHDQADLVSRVSKDNGATWSTDDTIVLANEGDWNVMSVSLLRLADGRIALFYMLKNSLTDCRPLLRYSTDEAQTWSDPVPIVPDDEIGYYVQNNDRTVQLESGRLIVPLALHNRPAWEKPDWDGTILCYLSDDAGKTWRPSTTAQQAHDAGGKRVTAQEPGVLELADSSAGSGQAPRLLMWVRTGHGEQYRCFSEDGGDTWSAFEPMGIASPRSPASIERIPSTGDLLLAWNNHAHLPLEERKLRTPFTLAVSKDDGATWGHIRNLDADPGGWFCYTAIHFTPDDHVLLGHCAGQRATGGLNTTRITRLPIASLYKK